jgi:hypothetical protein
MNANVRRPATLLFALKSHDRIRCLGFNRSFGSSARHESALKNKKPASLRTP